MKIKSSLAFILPAMAIFTGSAHAATLFQLDFDNNLNAGNPVTPFSQTGWETFSETINDTNNKTVAYSGYTGLSDGNISVTTTGVSFTRNINNGSTLTNFPGTDQDNLYNDLILRNAAGNIDITVAGLKAGTYTFTTHHLVQGASLAGANDFDLLVQDADSASFSQNEGNFLMGKGDATFYSPTAVVFNVTSNGTDPVIVRMSIPAPVGGGQGAWVGINGLEIQAIPEPSTALLGGLGLLALLRRRR